MKTVETVIEFLKNEIDESKLIGNNWMNGCRMKKLEDLKNLGFEVREEE